VVFLHVEPNRKGKIGWHYKQFSSKYYDDPYAILGYIVETLYMDLNDEIKALNDAVVKSRSQQENLLGVAKELDLTLN
jgi:hypothetical protein